MPILRRGFAIAFDLLGAFAWSFAALVFGSRFFNHTVGGVLAIAVLLSAIALSLSSHLQDLRMEQLAAGACPRCGLRIRPEHRHRRWDVERESWLAPQTSWECADCGFGHAEAWLCPQCP